MFTSKSKGALKIEDHTTYILEKEVGDETQKSIIGNVLFHFIPKLERLRGSVYKSSIKCTWRHISEMAVGVISNPPICPTHVPEYGVLAALANLQLELFSRIT